MNEQNKYFGNLDKIDCHIPLSLPICSKNSDIEQMQIKIRSSHVDHSKFNKFIESDQGKNLLNCLL